VQRLSFGYPVASKLQIQHFLFVLRPRDSATLLWLDFDPKRTVWHSRHYLSSGLVAFVSKEQVLDERGAGQNQYAIDDNSARYHEPSTIHHAVHHRLTPYLLVFLAERLVSNLVVSKPSLMSEFEKGVESVTTPAEQFRGSRKSIIRVRIDVANRLRLEPRVKWKHAR